MEQHEHILALPDLDRVESGRPLETVTLTRLVCSVFLVLLEESIEDFGLEKECLGHCQVQILHFGLELTAQSCTCWRLSATASQTSLSC